MQQNFLKVRLPWRVATVGMIVFLMAGTVWAEVASKEDARPEIPLGLDGDVFFVPADNPMTRDKVELGRLLFFDKRLSKDDTIACAACHMPEKAFTDGAPVSTGIKGQKGGRSAPTAINRGFSKAQFWDGRAETLEDQSIGPFVNPIEHGFANHDELVAKVESIKGYRPLFKKVFATDTITKEQIGKAIATFQRTLISGNSPFDRYDWEGDEKAISASAIRGRKLFFDKARCNLCHMGTNFSDEKFHNIGIGWDDEKVDLKRYEATKNPKDIGVDVGRYEVSKDVKDIGAFKTPTLREISNTAPYMHDGRFATLEEVVAHYNKGGVKNPFMDNQIIPLNLTEAEIKDLVEMLKTLNGEGWQQAQAPASFPR